MTESSATIVPVGTNVSTLGIDGLESHSHTAQRLKHASHEHLHLTTRRFFIGPIPEGWLNSNRKSWYKRRLDLNNYYSSRAATFDAAAQGVHRKATTLNVAPSLAARMNFSFPQPADVNSAPATPYLERSLSERDEANDTDGLNGEYDDEEEEEEEEEDENDIDDIEPTALAPIATQEGPQDLGITTTATTDPEPPNTLSVPTRFGSDGGKTSHRLDRLESRSKAESWKTAQEESPTVPRIATPYNDGHESSPYSNSNGRPSTSTRHGDGSNSQIEGMHESPDIIDGSSKTALLQPESPDTSFRTNHKQTETALLSPATARTDQKSLQIHSPAPLNTPMTPGMWSQQKPAGVRFKVTEGVAERRRKLGQRADGARYKVASKISRRSTLQEGTVIKMERMLVRIDVTMQQLPDDFDENESIKTEFKPIEKWCEFMVVARRGNKQDEEDYRLQLYKTRVIPEIENERTRKKPAREIKLLSHTTHVNLYSSLDKTVVIWHPYRKGTRTFIMKPSSTAHAVEWYTFLRDALGSRRPPNLQVNVPDLEVTLHVEKPFENIEATGREDADTKTLLAKAAEAEKAVAGRIIAQSMQMLAGDPEWSRILEMWSETAKMGLAWKRYDRLEWVHGINEQKMYGSMAMQHSHDLELRPKQHYPTHTYGKKGVLHEEPAPIEGFLIRLTSQKGMHKRWGKAFYKRLYFATYDKYLIFNRPAKAIPPHPPRLATLRGSDVPSAQEIVQSTPTMFDIEPFELRDGDIKWLKPDRAAAVAQSDLEALEEANRTLTNLIASDGFINMCRIVKVRRIQWGATEADEGLDSGDDVDFHVDVDNSRHEDGITTEIDDDRTFELVLDNDLIIRLQAYSAETRNAWMHRLRKLIKYWKLRASADTTNLKSTRAANLNNLNIDEDQEARMGQFAHKWEVSRSEANPEIYNMCRLTACRTITMSGMLYRKPRRRSTFQKCGVLLAGGQMLIYQATLRMSTGEQIKHIHQEKQQIIDLKDCYVYSGLIVEDDLLYQNRTFDTNHAGMLAATPRVYLNDGWTASDVDVMTCFVIWMNRRKGWFKSVSAATTPNDGDQRRSSAGEKKSQLKRVAQLGVPGRGMVFKCRSRAERDLWVTAVAAEIETAVEKELREQGKSRGDDLADVRLEQ